MKKTFSFITPASLIGGMLVASSLMSHAAPVTWGSAQTVVDNTDIQSAGVTGLAGVNFGAASTATTTVNNGSVDVDFKGMISNAQVTLSNGVTVESSDYSWFVACSAPAGVTGAYRTVMTRHMGASPSGTITLGNLENGTEYQIQVYITGSDANTTFISGSPALAAGGGNNPNNNNGYGQWVVGTFTADGVTQVLTQTANAPFEPVINALTIGTVDGEPDTTPPDWIASWPQADPLSSTSLTVRAQTNEAGIAYYVVLPNDATAPTSAQVKNGNDSSNAPAIADGSLALTANTEATAPVGSLSSGTAYDVYFVAEDAVPNVQASPIKVDVSTPAPDTTAPEWIATWPQAEQLSSTSLTVRAQTNETGTAYYVVLASGAIAPSAVQVKAGQDNLSAPAIAAGSLPLTANIEATGPVTGLTPATTYDVYFVAEDAVPNLQAAPVPVSASTESEPATITWGTASTVVDNTDIQNAGVTNLAGANFGLTTGTTTTVNNGSVDVEFMSMNSNQNVTLSNGVTVSASGYNFDVACSAPAGVTGDYRTVMTRHMGVGGGVGTITLAGLTIGVHYQIQAYITGSDPNTSTISGSPSLVAGGGNNANNNNGFGQWIVGTFTANTTSQALTHTANSNEPVINALTIGVVTGGPVNPYDTWASVNAPGDDPDEDFDGDGVSNAVEFVLGGDKDTNDLDKLPAVVASGGNMTFSFERDQSSTDASTVVTIEVSGDLATWDTAPSPYVVPDTATAGPPVAVEDNEDGTDTVTLTVAQVPDTKKFARLKVVITP